MGSMQSPVLAFDQHRSSPPPQRRRRPCLRPRAPALHGRTAEELDLDALLQVPTKASISPPITVLRPQRPALAVRRTTFRLRGAPHTLLVLSDVSAALREEERLAWQRLIRVLGHEINNSLTPIKSIAGSLRARIPAPVQRNGSNHTADRPRGPPRLRAASPSSRIARPR